MTKFVNKLELSIFADKMDGKLAYELYRDFLEGGQEILGIPEKDRLKCVMGIVMVEGKRILFNDFFRFEVNYGVLSQHYYNKT